MTSLTRIASIALCLGAASLALGACASIEPAPGDLATGPAPLCVGCTPADGYAQFGWDEGLYAWPYSYAYWPSYGVHGGWWHSHFHRAAHGFRHHR